jgi:hypothetical protein
LSADVVVNEHAACGDNSFLHSPTMRIIGACQEQIGRRRFSAYIFQAA